MGYKTELNNKIIDNLESQIKILNEIIEIKDKMIKRGLKNENL